MNSAGRLNRQINIVGSWVVLAFIWLLVATKPMQAPVASLAVALIASAYTAYGTVYEVRRGTFGGEHG